MKKKKRKKKTKLISRRLLRRAAKITGVAFLLPAYLVFLFIFVDPGPGFYMSSEARKLDGIKHEWKDIEHISPYLARSVVAAEDANFCTHFGFDIEAIKDAIKGGGKRGGSTISQQVAKNVFLWHGRSYFRKGLEAGFTVLIEVFWSKRRILEVYLNVAEFDTGVFGAEEAGKHYFGRSAKKLSPTQSARLAAVLPSPKKRSASHPSNFVRKRTGAIISGAGTIAADGRSNCFEDG